MKAICGITRRGFLFGLFSAAVGSMTKGVVRGKESRTKAYVLETFYVAGYRFHDGEGCEHLLDEGSVLDVIPEIGNPYDVHAVRLELDGAHIGYVPREMNKTLAQLLKQNAPVKARIVKVNRKDPPWHRVKVETFMSAVEGNLESGAIEMTKES